MTTAKTNAMTGMMTNAGITKTDATTSMMTNARIAKTCATKNVMTNVSITKTDVMTDGLRGISNEPGTGGIRTRRFLALLDFIPSLSLSLP